MGQTGSCCTGEDPADPPPNVPAPPRPPYDVVNYGRLPEQTYRVWTPECVTAVPVPEPSIADDVQNYSTALPSGKSLGLRLLKSRHNSAMRKASSRHSGCLLSSCSLA